VGGGGSPGGYPRLYAGPALFGQGIHGPEPVALVWLGAQGGGDPRVLLWRLRLPPSLRRDRPSPGTLRGGTDADRGVRAALVHGPGAHGSERSRDRVPGPAPRARLGKAGCVRAHALGHVPTDR